VSVAAKYRCAWLATVAVLGAASLDAQLPVTPRPAGPRTLVGVVNDTLGTPVDSAEIFIASLKRRVMSTPDGSFRLDDIKPGTYDVSARRLGYLPQLRKVKVGEDGGTTTFNLIPYVRGLAPVVSSSTRGGLSGVIGDTAYNIVAGAEISVIATDRRAVSDSTGSFYMDLKPGRYMVRVKREGFGSKLASVTIPNDSGRRIVVWLSPSSGPVSRREDWAIDSLRRRLLVRNPVWSAIYTREDILRMGVIDAAQLATIGARGPVADNCPAFIDGGPTTAPIWAFSAADIETIEVYTPRRTSYAPTSITSRGHLPAASQASECSNIVYLWLRK
jgi:hypothetical protein